MLFSPLFRKQSFRSFHLPPPAMKHGLAWLVCMPTALNRVINLKSKLGNLTQGDKPAAEFLQSIKVVAHELAIIGFPQSDTDLVIHCLRGLGPAYKEVVAVVINRQTPITFEDLYDQVVEHEILGTSEQSHEDPTPITANFASGSNSRPGHNNNRGHNKISQPHFSRGNSQSPLPFSDSRTANRRSSGSNVVICQYCDKRVHTARQCHNLFPQNRPKPLVNHTTTSTTHNGTWLMDSAASHHITSDLANLSLHKNYEGPDDVVIGDGSGLKNGGTPSPWTE